MDKYCIKYSFWINKIGIKPRKDCLTQKLEDFELDFEIQSYSFSYRFIIYNYCYVIRGKGFESLR